MTTSNQAAPLRRTGLRHHARRLKPSPQVIRYLIVGVCNTIIGLGTSAFALFLFNRFLPTHIHGIAMTQARLTVASTAIATPFNITLAYLNYKFFVFRTRGNFVSEWLKAFGVYGVSSVIGLVLLGVLTKAIEVMLHGYAPLGKGTPGYIAMVGMTSVTTVISYIGHKKVTFGGSPGHDEDAAAVEGILGHDASAKLDATLQEPSAQ